MAETTEISWADATLNLWVGCTKVSNGKAGACAHCYAETWAARWPRYQGTWGPGAPRVRTVGWAGKIQKLRKLAIAKAERGEGAFFCFVNSLSDFWDNEVPIEWLTEAFALMAAAPEVTFLLLTKRPQNIVKRFWQSTTRAHTPKTLWQDWPRNCAIGCTVVTDAEATRDVPWLLAAKQALRPAFAFLSIEPLMGPVRLLGRFIKKAWNAGIDWVIAGGESGVDARPSDPADFIDLDIQCWEASVPFHFKQWGEWVGRDPKNFREFNDGKSRRMPSGMFVRRVGKKAAGRNLRGRIHDARPIPKPLEAA